MKAIVHIGLPKTGTTTIQRTLVGNIEALAQQGVLYDRVPNVYVPLQDSQLEFGICQFARAAAPVPDAPTRAAYLLSDQQAQLAFASEFEATFEARLRKLRGDTYVISSEHIGAWTSDVSHVKALDAWLSSVFDEVRYVCYIRRQEDWLLSRYSQHLRSGYSVTLDTFLERNAFHDFGAKAGLWAEGVGRDRFDLRLLEKDFLVGSDLVTDFAKVVGFDATELPRPERTNESLSVAAAAFLRILNDKVRPRVDGGRMPNPVIKGLEPRLTRWYAKDRKLKLSPEQAELVATANAEVNAALCAEWFPDRRQLFTPRPVPVDPMGNDPTAEEMAQIAIDILRAFRFGRMKALDEDEMRLVFGPNADQQIRKSAKGAS